MFLFMQKIKTTIYTKTTELDSEIFFLQPKTISLQFRNSFPASCPPSPLHYHIDFRYFLPFSFLSQIALFYPTTKIQNYYFFVL